MRMLPYAIALTMLATACGDDGDEQTKSIDCEFFVSDNCWREVAAAAEPCLPDGPGVFAEDRASCTWDDGHGVEFDAALPVQVPDEQPWNFTVSQGGETCLEVETRNESGRSRQTLTTSAGSVTLSTSDAGEMKVSCPNGDVYAGKLLDLFQCENGAAFSVPGVGGSSFDGEVNVIVNGAGEPGAIFSMMEAFTCEEAAPITTGA